MSEEVLRDWLELWARAGAELDAIRRREIAALTDEDVRDLLDDLSQHRCGGMPSLRTDSGLVEQQRWFACLRAPR
jgi:hypothetical protein